jgi:LacI family transcriptional regulator
MAEATLVEVARAAGVSQSTASRVLNGSTRRVRPENAARVRAAAERLGYAVDLRAQATARRMSSTVAILVDTLTDARIMAMAEHARSASDDAGLLAQITVCPAEPGRAREVVRLLRGQRPRCIVLVLSTPEPSSAVADELDRYRAHGGLPVVLEPASAGDSAHAVTGFVRLISSTGPAA